SYTYFRSQRSSFYNCARRSFACSHTLGNTTTATTCFNAESESSSYDGCWCCIEWCDSPKDIKGPQSGSRSVEGNSYSCYAVITAFVSGDDSAPLVVPVLREQHQCGFNSFLALLPNGWLGWPGTQGVANTL